MTITSILITQEGTGFMIVMRDRIINAVENERKLNQLEIL